VSKLFFIRAALQELTRRTLKGRELKGHFSIWVSGNWRLTFTFDGLDAILVDYQDYH